MPVGTISRVLNGVPVPVNYFWGKLEPERFPSLPLFDGFPYLVTKVVPMLFHVTLLPDQISEPRLEAVARGQRSFNQLDVCLALSRLRCFYYQGEQSSEPSKCLPWGADIVYGRLAPLVGFPNPPELAERTGRLRDYAKEHNEDGYVFGDLTKGGHPATQDELNALSGRQSNGVPMGLACCSVCHEWRGQCIDPNSPGGEGVRGAIGGSSQDGGLVVIVRCLCDNNNRCAVCGELFAEHKLNTNWYDPSDDKVWHQPGLAALDHKCEL